MAKGKKADSLTLDAAIASMEKEFGAGMVFDLSKAGIAKVPTVSWGSFKLDRITGGIPIGRIIEIFGPESSGKTTLTLQAIKQFQKDERFRGEGRKALFIDAEHAIDLDYAVNGIGVDKDQLILAQPDSGEQALELLERFIRSGKISVAVVDSVAALTPQAEIDGEMGDAHVGLQSRLMSQAMRKLNGLASKTNTTIFFLNQIRMKIGVMWGNPETTSGGNALKFYASQRLDIRAQNESSSFKDASGEAVSQPRNVKVIKNKIQPPFKKDTILITFGQGLDVDYELAELADQHDIVEKSGAWYSYEGSTIAQGFPNLLKLLKTDKDLRAKIEAELRNKLQGLSSTETDLENHDDEEED